MTTQPDIEPVARRLDDAAGRLSMAIGRLARVLRRDAPSGLGAGSLSALATVVRYGPARLGDVAVREGIAPPTLSRIIAALEDSGYVVRAPDPTDKRATTVEATAAARELISGTGSSRAAAVRLRMAALSEADLNLLLSAVPVLEALAADD
jgi:DNA-binding MarR family transcriptional regulator